MDQKNKGKKGAATDAKADPVVADPKVPAGDKGKKDDNKKGGGKKGGKWFMKKITFLSEIIVFMLHF